MDVTKPFKLGPNQMKWLAALTSRMYQHGKRRLCIETAEGPKFCCLGVAAEIFGLPHRKTKDQCFKGMMVRGYGRNQRMISVAPAEVVNALCLRDECGKILNSNDNYSLAKINDYLSTTDYAPIIRIIEETPELIFTEPA